MKKFNYVLYILPFLIFIGCNSNSHENSEEKVNGKYMVQKNGL